MGKEELQPEQIELSLKSFIEVARDNPDQFNRGCDSLVDYQISPKTINDIVQAIDSGRKIVLITNHQSYFEIETQRYFCQLISQNSKEKVQAILMYSAPAVAHNVGRLLQLRDNNFSDSGLNMLGIIRDDDRKHPVYKLSINEEMELQDKQSRRAFTRALISDIGNIVINPFEATLEGGRIDPETKEIKGMQPVDENCLDVYINRNFLILPCGIDGSYKLIDPKTHLPSTELLQAVIMTPSTEKIVTFKVGNFNDPISLRELGLSNQQICHNAIVDLARLVSPEAQGYWRKYLAA